MILHFVHIPHASVGQKYFNSDKLVPKSIALVVGFVCLCQKFITKKVKKKVKTQIALSQTDVAISLAISLSRIDVVVSPSQIDVISLSERGGAISLLDCVDPCKKS